MKKDNRQLYLDTWREYLKGKNQIEPKALAEFLEDRLQKDFSGTTLKRYTATVIANLYENGFLAGKKGKTFTGEPLELVREITPYILDQALTANYKKVKFGASDKPTEKIESSPAGPKARKAKVPKAERPARRKPGPKKKVAEKPIKDVAVKSKKKPGRKPGKKPGRKPGEKAAGQVPAVQGRKMAGRRADVIKKGQQALEFFLDQQRQIDEMALALANYERVFEAVRRLFGREMVEIEELVAGLLE